MTLKFKIETLFVSAWLILSCSPPVTQAQKLSHSAVITGVKERIVRAEGSPSDRDGILQSAIELLKSNAGKEKKEKDKEETYFYLGYLYYRTMDFEKAYESFRQAASYGRKHLDKGEKLSGGIVIFSINETLNDIKLKTFNQANRAYSDVTATTSADSTVMLMKNAIAKFTQLLSWDSTATVNGQSFVANVQGLLANANIQLMNVEQDDAKRSTYRTAAIGHLEKFLEVDKNNLPVYQFIVQLHFQAKDNAKCVEWINKALAVGKNDTASQSVKIKAELISQKALILDVMGKPDEALSTYQEAIASNPDNADLHFNLARLYLNRKEASKALEEFKIVKRLKPNDPEAGYQVADEVYRVYLRRRGEEIDKAGAKADMKKISDLLAPDMEDLKKNLEEAIMVLNNNLSDMTDQAEVLYRIGKCYNMIAEVEGHKASHLENKEKVRIQKPYFEKAVEFLKKSLVNNPDHKTTWHQLGTAYLNLQMKKEAEEAFAKAK